MNAPLKMTAPTQEDLNIAVYGSLCRVLERAPIEKKLRVFSLLAGAVADEVATYAQTQIAGLRYVADAAGLNRLVGTAFVERAIGTAFWGDDR